MAEKVDFDFSNYVYSPMTGIVPPETVVPYIKYKDEGGVKHAIENQWAGQKSADVISIINSSGQYSDFEYVYQGMYLHEGDRAFTALNPDTSAPGNENDSHITDIVKKYKIQNKIISPDEDLIIDKNNNTKITDNNKKSFGLGENFYTNWQYYYQSFGEWDDSTTQKTFTISLNDLGNQLIVTDNLGKTKTYSWQKGRKLYCFAKTYEIEQTDNSVLTSSMETVAYTNDSDLSYACTGGPAWYNTEYTDRMLGGNYNNPRIYFQQEKHIPYMSGAILLTDGDTGLEQTFLMTPKIKYSEISLNTEQLTLSGKNINVDNWTEIQSDNNLFRLFSSTRQSKEYSYTINHSFKTPKFIGMKTNRYENTVNLNTRYNAQKRTIYYVGSKSGNYITPALAWGISISYSPRAQLLFSTTNDITIQNSTPINRYFKTDLENDIDCITAIGSEVKVKDHTSMSAPCGMWDKIETTSKLPLGVSIDEVKKGIKTYFTSTGDTIKITPSDCYNQVKQIPSEQEFRTFLTENSLSIGFNTQQEASNKLLVDNMNPDSYYTFLKTITWQRRRSTGTPLIMHLSDEWIKKIMIYFSACYNANGKHPVVFKNINLPTGYYYLNTNGSPEAFAFDENTPMSYCNFNNDHLGGFTYTFNLTETQKYLLQFVII